MPWLGPAILSNILLFVGEGGQTLTLNLDVINIDATSNRLHHWSCSKGTFLLGSYTFSFGSSNSFPLWRGNCEAEGVTRVPKYRPCKLFAKLVKSKVTREASLLSHPHQHTQSHIFYIKTLVSCVFLCCISKGKQWKSFPFATCYCFN